MSPYEVWSSYDALAGARVVALSAYPGWGRLPSEVLKQRAPLPEVPLEKVEISRESDIGRVRTISAVAVLVPAADQADEVEVAALAIVHGGEVIGQIEWDVPFVVKGGTGGLRVPLEVLVMDGGPADA